MAIFNKFMVGVKGDNIVIARPAAQMNKEDALLLAAYLVTLATLASSDPMEEFQPILDAVRQA